VPASAADLVEGPNQLISIIMDKMGSVLKEVSVDAMPPRGRGPPLSEYCREQGHGDEAQTLADSAGQNSRPITRALSVEIATRPPLRKIVGEPGVKNRSTRAASRSLWSFPAEENDHVCGRRDC
jgi:hypothetical protein